MLAPAMNRVMWANKATQANVATLVARGVRILGPASGNQACGEIGEGRMWEPLQLAEALLGRARQRRPADRPECIDHRRARPASVSIRCAISPIAAPEKWALPWRPPPAKPARMSPS